MVKKMFLTAAVAGLLMGAAAVAQPSPALACSGCWKLAHATYPHDAKARKAYRKACKHAFRHWWPKYWAKHHRAYGV
jgi:hypothetical protein